MVVRVKICGITRLRDALLAVDLGADALGFNFWPQSKRYISPRHAARIISQLPARVDTVGVFVNPTRAELRRAVKQCLIQTIQLHGDESPWFCDRCELPVIKALSVSNAFSLRKARRYVVSSFLFDTASVGFGGSGTAFDWDLLRRVPRRTPFLLAGGLTTDNVRAAVRQVRPDGVDVASGVESAPGIKDRRKMKQFITSAKEA